MKKNLLLCVLAILTLVGYAFCAAPLAVAMPINYYGVIALWTVFIFTMEEIYWNFLTDDDDKEKDNNQN